MFGVKYGSKILASEEDLCVGKRSSYTLLPSTTGEVSGIHLAPPTATELISNKQVKTVPQILLSWPYAESTSVEQRVPWVPVTPSLGAHPSSRGQVPGDKCFQLCLTALTAEQLTWLPVPGWKSQHQLEKCIWRGIDQSGQMMDRRHTWRDNCTQPV